MQFGYAGEDLTAAAVAQNLDGFAALDSEFVANVVVVVVAGGSMGIFVIGLLFYRRKKVPAEVVVADSFSNRSRRRTRSLKLNPGELFITSENKAYIGRSASANPLYSK